MVPVPVEDVVVPVPVEDVVVPVPVELVVEVALPPPKPPKPLLVVVEVALPPPKPPMPVLAVVEVAFPPKPPTPPLVVVEVTLPPPKPPMPLLVVAEVLVTLELAPESVPASAMSGTQVLPEQISVLGQVPQKRVPPQASGTDPQVSPAGHLLIGVQVAQMSSCEGVDDCWQVAGPAQVAPVAVHCSQAAKSTLPLFVSHTEVAPLHESPSSPQEHLRQPVTVVPEQTAWAGPVLVHLPCWLLQSCCTTHLRPETVMVSPALPSSQMSAISPQLLSLSPQAPGAA